MLNFFVWRLLIEISKQFVMIILIGVKQILSLSAKLSQSIRE